VAKYIFIEIYLHSEEGMGAVEKFFLYKVIKRRKEGFPTLSSVLMKWKKELNKQK